MLQEACRELERNGDHAIAAHVGHSMALIERKYGVGEDHLDLDTSDGSSRSRSRDRSTGA